MNTVGLLRLEKLRAQLNELSSQQNCHIWVGLIIDKLSSSSSQEHLLAEYAQYQQQQIMHLQTVWGFVLRQVDIAIKAEKVVPLLQNIIRFLYLPDTLDSFFIDDSTVQWALLTLHPILQLQIRHRLLESLDELLVGCESAADFIDRKFEPDLYNLLDTIIKNANKYAIKRQRSCSQVNAVSGTSLPESLHERSLTSLIELSVWQLTYLSPLAALENISAASSQTSILPRDIGEHFPAVVTLVPKLTMSPTMAQQLFSNKEVYVMPKWMSEGLTLNEDLLAELREYQDELYNKFCALGTPVSRKIEQKLAFIDTIIHKATTNALTPEVLFKATQDKPYLFVAFFRSRLHRFWQTLRCVLREALWNKAKQHGNDNWGYSITDTALAATLKNKQKSMPPPVTLVNHHSLPLTSTARWHQEKRAALDYIIQRHHLGCLMAADFQHIKKTFPLYTASRMTLFRKSATESILDQAEKYIQDLLWIDSGGEGELLQKQLRESQKKNVCVPNYRRLT